MKKKEFGLKGESLAVHFLKERHYEILEQNWYYKHKEIDIIAAIEEFLVIIEVKTRSSEGIETPNELVSRKKQRFLIDATEAYIHEKDIEKEARFDVIFVYFENGEPKLEHIEDAFQPSLL